MYIQTNQDQESVCQRGRPHKGHVDVQRSIRKGSLEELAKKILNTPRGEINLRSFKEKSRVVELGAGD